MSLEPELLFNLHLDVETPAAAVCPTDAGERKLFIVRGGTFEGPKLKGTVLPGCVDWGLAGSDGLFRLDVRAVLQTDDGALIAVTYRGIRDIPADYWRTTPEFSTTSEPYRWLTRLVAVGVVTKVPTGVDYQVYRV